MSRGRWMPKLPQRALRLAACLAAVAAVTFLATRVIAVNATTAGFAYLLLVLVVASTWGFLESAVTTVLSTLTFDFFFVPPTGALGPYKTEDLGALFSFLATSLIASPLSRSEG